ncbi:MAG: hypothetical protein I8H80_02320 [Alphaproteobacteria bacterium]|nr:hypothetical protein [Alphaproteobacteria bacterium]
MNLKLAFLLTGFVTSTVYAAESTSSVKSDSSDSSTDVQVVFEMTDDERLEFAIKKSVETAAAEENFRAKRAEYENNQGNSIGLVEFETLRRNVGEIASGSDDESAIQIAIDTILEVQKSRSLTDEQKDQVDGFLISLVSRMSVLTSEENLGARNRAFAR